MARNSAAHDASHKLHMFLLRRRKDYWVASREFSTDELRINLSSDGASPVSVVDVSSGDLQGEERCIWLGPERFHPFPINLCTLFCKVLKEKRFIGHAVYIYGTRFSFFPRPCALGSEIRVSKPLGPCLGGFLFFKFRLPTTIGDRRRDGYEVLQLRGVGSGERVLAFTGQMFSCRLTSLAAEPSSSVVLFLLLVAVRVEHVDRTSLPVQNVRGRLLPEDRKHVVLESGAPR